MENETITYSSAIIAGLLSFFSPCVLPLLPTYFTLITGLSIDEIQTDTNKIRVKVIISTIFYVLGFSFIFILMGASASFLGAYLLKYSNIIKILAGITMIIFGLYFTNLLSLNFLQFEKKIHIKNNALGFIGAFIIGMAFAAGWTPCIGPVLGSMLAMAMTQNSTQNGMILLAVYSFGFGLPFIIISFFINYIFKFLKKASKILKYINFIAGVFLIILGIFLIFNLGF